ncbi:MAG: acetyl-CoA carboxylase biotin carboxyl carrier protein [Vicinamibacterales bacterium]
MSAMEFDEIKQILDMMREHDLVEFELEREDFKVRLKKQGAGQWAVAPVAAPPVVMAAPPPASAAAVAAQAAPADDDREFAVVKSPIVGTFYRSSEPGAAPYADVGDTVKKGQVLCIIEAMKLMNEINAECDGQVVKCYVENGQAVQYGERLFALKPHV